MGSSLGSRRHANARSQGAALNAPCSPVLNVIGLLSRPGRTQVSTKAAARATGRARRGRSELQGLARPSDRRAATPPIARGLQSEPPLSSTTPAGCGRRREAWNPSRPQSVRM